MKTSTQKPILDSVMNAQSDSKKMQFKPSSIASDVLEHVPTRMCNVLAKRFGLEGKDRMTLEQIGKKQGITRERVRQIEAEALSILAEQAKSHIEEAEALILDVFEQYGGVMAEDHLFEAILEPGRSTLEEQQALLFLLKLINGTKRKTQSKEFHTLWMTDTEAFDIAKKLIDETSNALQKVEKVHAEEDFFKLVCDTDSAGEKGSELSNDILSAYISISKNIRKNPFGEWGLSKWPEVTPRGVKDKAYIVAKRHKKPLHFTEIAEKINQTRFDHKTAYPQTVHNELIKDDRFVLVGRGIYALNEWGYKPGTVLDVIIEVVKNAGAPLTRDEIIERVLARRKVRRNTIVLNLQNAECFERIEGKKYCYKG